MTIEHNFNSRVECNMVKAWIDENIGIEYEVTFEDDNQHGTIMVFDMEYEEFEEFKSYLHNNSFI